MDSRTVHVVPHTHWDREWYASFQSFRLRLVDLLDDLLPRMESDPSYGRFLLDGQLAVVDDYLAVRPDAEDRLRRLVGSGRIAVGPWYTLPDEFLVSGETLIRNLQLGLHTADRFGGAMTVGYRPDMFGHVAQMPQILRHFGFEHAVVWRGVPAAVDRSGFWWRAPDGSTVRAEYLPQGYGNGSALPDDAKQLVAQVGAFADLWEGLVTGPVLWMNGTDHQAPQPWLGRVVAEANDIQDDLRFEVVSLAEHMATAPTDGLAAWEGELRSGARANLLMGVTSNRVDVRQAAARAERTLEQLAEPLSALFLPPERWPAALLAEAWRGVIRNAAHDSVCACSIDDVCDAVVHRYTEATDIGQGLAERAVAGLAARLDRRAGPTRTPTPDPGSAVVVNPSARPRGGLVEVRVPGAEPPPGTQLLRRHGGDMVLEGPADLVTPAAEQIDWSRSNEAFSLESEDGRVLVANERRNRGQLVTPAVRAALAAIDEPGTLRLKVRRPASATVLACVEDVPGFGWATWSPDHATGRPRQAVTVDGTALSNGLVRVDVDPTDGTFALDGHGGLGRLVDGGDCGDTYNYCPPTDDTLVDRPDEVSVETLESGPVRARVQVTARYRWPASAEGLDRRVGEVAHEVRTVIELRAGEAVARAEVTVDNRSRDHRLRAHLPLPEPAERSRAECAFAIVERGLEAEGGPTEVGLPTFPARRFVQAGGLTVVHDGVVEYELVDVRDGRAHELALTLLRCTGMLSQGPMATRPLPAGPLTPIEGPQLQKTLTLRYAVAVGDVDPYALADDVLLPLVVARPIEATRGTDNTTGSPTDDSPTGPDDETRLPARGSALTVHGAEVSAVTRDGGTLAVRVFNPRPEPTTVTIEGRNGWLVDLRGRPQQPFEGSFDLKGWGIATASLRP
jgi:2-O-(6-phospho-alpha-D-mannosyl)-D-glycerate hydrolase